MTTLSAPPITAKKNIYIVTDDDMTRILLQETFWIYSKYDHNISVFHSLEEVQQKIQEGMHPDILLIGISLPTIKKDPESPASLAYPFSFIKKYKKEYPETKIVVYSKHDEPALLTQAKNACADTCIVAGQSTPSEIVDIVEKL